MSRRKKALRILLRLLSLALLLCVCFGIYCLATYRLTVVHHTVNTGLTGSLRILQLTDLHCVEYGENNRELVELVRSQEPDIIVMTGDMLNRNNADSSVAMGLVKELSSIADIYYGYGNHEIRWISHYGDTLEQQLTDAGAIVLNNRYVDLSVGGMDLRLGGYMGYYRAPHLTSSSKEVQQLESAFFEDFENTERYKILLNHIPTGWLDWNYRDKYPVDLVFSGHYHGGQVRLPLIGGLYAPYVGAFPEYTGGIFYGQEATCILSTGLGSEPGIPRINNPPQIIVADLIP